MNFVAIDFETANSSRDSACSLGMVKVLDDRIVEEWYELIKPPKMLFEPINVSIHGITAKDVVNAKTFGELWSEIYSFIDGYQVVAHNASFDFSVIRKCLDTYDLDYPEFDYYCTVIASKISWPELSRHDLHSLSDFLNIELEHHNALADAKACAKILIDAARNMNAQSLDEFCERSATTKGQIFCKGYRPASMSKKRKTCKLK